MAQLKPDMPYLTTADAERKLMGYRAACDWQNTIKTMQAAGVLKSSVNPPDVFTYQFLSDQFLMK